MNTFSASSFFYSQTHFQALWYTAIKFELLVTTIVIARAVHGIQNCFCQMLIHLFHTQQQEGSNSLNGV